MNEDLENVFCCSIQEAIGQTDSRVAAKFKSHDPDMPPR